MTNSPFDGVNQQTPGETPPVTDNPFADKLGSIVNDAGEPKYKDVESALDALKHSQDFIEKLKAEKAAEEQAKAELAAELEKRKSVEEAITSLVPKSDPKPKAEGDPPKPSLDADAVAKLVQDQLSQITSQQTAAQNVDTVSKALNEKFGDKAAEAVTNRAKELNTTAQDLEKLAASNPAMVLSLFGDVSIQNNNPTKTSMTSPQSNKDKVEAPKPAKSIMQGGTTSREVGDYFKQVREYTNKRLGVVE